MSLLHFHKYQGTGNDFIMIDNRNSNFNAQNLQLINQLCDRRFGIGADGLILVVNHSDFDFEMIYFNADGSQSFCGNGSRCAVLFACHLGIVQNKAHFLAIDGDHYATVDKDQIEIRMNPVREVKVLNNGDVFINTGSPHHISWNDNIESVQLVTEGREVRYSEMYAPDGTNVNFAHYHPEEGISVRTYERGVEGETLSCGTGVTAVALAGAERGAQSPISVKTKGGDLQVSFTKSNNGKYDDIYLRGPAKKVFEGEIEIQ